MNLRNQILKFIGQTNKLELSYSEFYSETLFSKIKREINYNGEWSVAYGMHPGILEYNGISTLDGYHSYYSENYKQKFRKIIAPCLEISEFYRNYFDDWGGRAYIFSPDVGYQPLRKMNIESAPMYIDPKAFSDLEGKYVFSRVKIENADELKLVLVGDYTTPESPYHIWVYSI